MTTPTAVPRRYQGVEFRSTLEADWAATLDHYGIEWEYESHLFELKSGEWYLPDFWLPKLRTFIEAKGTGVPRSHKPAGLAAEAEDLDVDLIVLIGYPPHVRALTEYAWERFTQWRDAAGYDARFIRCDHCSEWGWIRPRRAVNCRRCGAKHLGYLAAPGEMSFKAVDRGSGPTWQLGIPAEWSGATEWIGGT